MKSMATLAQELNITTVAEYIEDADIRQAVCDVGIDPAQGFHMGMPSSELTVTPAASSPP